MSVSGIVCHLIMYFPVNQGLAINLPYPALKNKQCMCFELFEVFLTSSADYVFVVDNLHLQIIEIIYPTKHPTSRLYLIIGPLHCRRGIILSHNEIKCSNESRNIFHFLFLMIYTYKLFKAFPPYLAGSSLPFVNNAK